MKFFVDDNCIGCGYCRATCPEVFTIGADGMAHAIDSEVPDSDIDSASDALECCPVNAIREI